jgi:hypothetical protein
MKRWALVVLGLYLLILIVFTVPVILACFRGAQVDALGVYATCPYWVWVAVMILSQAALLMVPVHLAERRPVARRSLVLPVVSSGLLMGCLGVGAVYCLGEAIFHDHVPNWVGWGGPAAGILIWFAWGAVFFRLSRSLEAGDLISRQCRLLLKGSILELLVAVPSHIWVRRQNYCCAGFMTFIGIAFGLSVMLFSFGPAVFLLYVERLRRLHPNGPK